MGATFSRVKTWIAGETLTAADLNAEFDNILNNLDPDGIDDASTNAAAMQATADPYPGSVASLATDLTGEFHRIRYVLDQRNNTSYWYIYPDMVTKTTTYTAGADDEIILCDTSGGAWTLTLPTAVGIQHKRYIIVLSTAGNDLTVDGNGAQTIGGSATKTLDTQYEYLVIVSDNANWQIIGDNIDGVTLTGTQTLTNKTLTSPSITFDGSTWPSFSVHRNGSVQSIANNTWVKVQWTTEIFDTNSDFDVATNYRFTPTVAGKYLLSFNCTLTGGVDQTQFRTALYKNGAAHKYGNTNNFSGTADLGSGGAPVVDANGSTDYFEVYVFHNIGSAQNLSGSTANSWFTGCRIG